MHKICIIGPSGSGKGTQAELLSEKLGIPTASMGQLLRDEVAKGGENSKELELIMEKGQHVPDDIPNALMTDWMQRALQEAGGYIVEGYPRNMEQYKYLESRNNQFCKVIILNISDNEVMERVTGRRVCSCGAKFHMKYNPPKQNETCDYCNAKLIIRGDNTPEATKARIQLYHEKMLPVIDEYKAKGLVTEIDGEQTIQRVHEEILGIFDSDK